MYSKIVISAVSMVLLMSGCKENPDLSKKDLKKTTKKRGFTRTVFSKDKLKSFPAGAYFENTKFKMDEVQILDEKEFKIPSFLNVRNYRKLRDNDNIYILKDRRKITWNNKQVKIPYNNKVFMVGTDFDDSFNINYYKKFGNYFDLSSINNFLAGNGNDTVGGSDNNDNISGGLGNDTLLGYRGDDKLYGGKGKDIIYGHAGDDLLHGGQGIDVMKGGLGNDTYIINNIEDAVFEKENEGYDTIVSGITYHLNKNIEELHLAEGFNIHATGNSLDNKLIGNNLDNIINGVTGKDIMVGKKGNDLYYVDQPDDIIIELKNEGIDTVQTFSSYKLPDNLENINLLDFSKPEKGVIDGESVIIYGYPLKYELDYIKGDAKKGYDATSTLVSIANLLTMTGRPTTEKDIIKLASDNGWGRLEGDLKGASNYIDQQNILDEYNISNDLIYGYNPHGIANLTQAARVVLCTVNSGKLWDDTRFVKNGESNHMIAITGSVFSEDNMRLKGFYIVDPGRKKVSDMARYVTIEKFKEAAFVPNGYSIYTVIPEKLWDEDINVTGNSLNNTILGNRANNVINSGKGDDILDGKGGKDTYIFNKGDGVDTIDSYIEKKYRYSIREDKIVFGKGINKKDLSFIYDNNQLNINYTPNDKIIFLDPSSSSISKIEFENSTYINYEDILDAIKKVNTNKNISTYIKEYKTPPLRKKQSSYFLNLKAPYRSKKAVNLDKKKIVYKIYQLTDFTLGICKGKEYKLYRDTIEKFKKTYPELMELVKKSKHYKKVVKDNFSRIERINKHDHSYRVSKCKRTFGMLKKFIETNKGKKEVKEMIAKLKQKNMKKQNLKEIMEKTPDLFPKDIKEAILKEKVILGMSPYQAQLAGGSCSYMVEADSKVWGENPNPIKVIKAQTYNPDDSKIALTFKNSTQYSEETEQIFKVRFEKGRVVTIEKVLKNK